MIRVASGIVLAVLVVAAVWLLPFWWLVLVAEGLLVLAFLEYARLVDALGVRLPKLAAGAAAASVCAAFARPSGVVELVLIAAMIGLAAVTLAGARPVAGTVHEIGAASLAILYLGLPFGSLVGLRAAYGREPLLLLLAVVVVSDTTQYYGGRLAGRRKLAPAISPHKTVEGAAAGFAAGAIVMAAAGDWAMPPAPILWRIGVGVAVVAAGIAGDLFESLLKRAAGVKDSSALVPGHGGVLDRIDALLFAAPVFYLMLRFAAVGPGGW